jgi:hypothetical protein
MRVVAVSHGLLTSAQKTVYLFGRCAFFAAVDVLRVVVDAPRPLGALDLPLLIIMSGGSDQSGGHRHTFLLPVDERGGMAG